MNVVFVGRSNGKTETIRKILDEIGREIFTYQDTDSIIYAGSETRRKIHEAYRRMCNVPKTSKE